MLSLARASPPPPPSFLGFGRVTRQLAAKGPKSNIFNLRRNQAIFLKSNIFDLSSLGAENCHCLLF